MDKGEALRIAKLYVESVSNSYNVSQAILFGSVAKGTYRDDSDINVAISGIQSISFSTFIIIHL